MISHQNKCIFVHIPKNAGQSIESVFVKNHGLTWNERSPLLLKPNFDPNKGPPRLAHLTAQEYIGCAHIPEELFNQYFKFSFTRNPWDRLVSEYNYRKAHGDLNYQASFKLFVMNNFPDVTADNYTSSKDYYRHIIPQWKFLYDNDGNCLVDFIGRFEKLQLDFDKVCQQINLANSLLPHKNKSLSKLKKIKKTIAQIVTFNRKEKKHYSDYYDEETKDFVAKYYAKDIELFGYSFIEK